MTTVTIQQAQSALVELIHRLSQEDELVISGSDRPVAYLVPMAEKPHKSLRRLGTMKGVELPMASDFDAQLKDFDRLGIARVRG